VPSEIGREVAVDLNLYKPPMACMGPYKDEKGGEELYEAFVSAMTERRLLTSPAEHVVKPIWECRQKLLAQLKELAAELVYQEACESF
jgi:hypothetical protein